MTLISIKRYSTIIFCSWHGAKSLLASLKEFRNYLQRMKLLIEINVIRTHFQCAILLKAMEADPSTLEPPEYGWTKEEDMFLPLFQMEWTFYHPSAPRSFENHCVQLPVMIHVQANCTCRKDKMACSMFCKCQDVECFSSLKLWRRQWWRVSRFLIYNIQWSA